MGSCAAVRAHPRRIRPNRSDGPQEVKPICPIPDGVPRPESPLGGGLPTFNDTRSIARMQVFPHRTALPMSPKPLPASLFGPWMQVGARADGFWSERCETPDIGRAELAMAHQGVQAGPLPSGNHRVNTFSVIAAGNSLLTSFPVTRILIGYERAPVTT